MNAKQRALVERIRRKVNAFLAGADADGYSHELRSRRSLASEIGMSPTGLKKFADGSMPYAPTFRQLRSWYASLETSDGEGEIALRIEMLADTFPVEHRGAAALRLRAAYDDLRAIYPHPRTSEPTPPDLCRICRAEIATGQLREHLRLEHGRGDP